MTTIRALRRKPLNVLLGEEENGKLLRTLSLFDLTAIGIGATVGSGVFSLIGEVAATQTGPGVIVSLGFASVACIFTGNSYIKLSRAIPSTGSVYAYSYHCLGEVFAMLAGFCLTLEYAISGFGVARSWGSKLANELDVKWVGSIDVGFAEMNLAATVLSMLCVGLCLFGADVGKLFTNGMTVLKCAVVAFMIVVSLSYFSASNLEPIIPPRVVEPDGKAKFGIDGFFQGTSACFWAFIGFDEICCLAGEAKDPKRDMPRAVVLSVLGTAVLTITAAVGLVGMQNYKHIDKNSGWKVGFDSHGAHWAAEIASIGELVTLPVVVFLGVLPQARLFYAMALDGMVPLIFTKVSGRGVLRESNLIIGFIGFFQAMFLDFGTIADLTSAGVLLSFALCNSSLIMLTLTSPAELPDHGTAASRTYTIGGSQVSGEVTSPNGGVTAEDDATRSTAGKALAVFSGAGFISLVLVAGLVLPSSVLGAVGSANSGIQVTVAVLAAIFGVMTLVALGRLACMSHSPVHGGVWMPAIGSLVDFFIIATLSKQAFYQFAGVFAFALLVYAGYGVHHSAANHAEWQRASLMDSALRGPEDDARVEQNTQEKAAARRTA